MSDKPLLTIGIPTYNRASFLKQSLGWICSEAGNNKDVEIIVCDNCSTDNTEAVVRKYKVKNSNLRYVRQSSNLGFDKNLKTIFDLAEGVFVKPHGDDDFMSVGAIKYLLSILRETKGVDLFFINKSCRMMKEFGVGYDRYIKGLSASNGITFLTSIIISKDSYNKIELKDRYLDSKIYQLYLQLEVLRQNPNFCFIGKIGFPDSGKAERRFYNVGEVFIKNYFDILYEYEKFGLSKSVITEEKSIVFYRTVKPLITMTNQGRDGITKENIIDIFTEYYKEEAYFEKELAWIKNN